MFSHKMLFNVLNIFVLLNFQSILVISKSPVNTNSSNYLTKLVQNADFSSFPRHALQATRDIACYVDTKLINFYYVDDDRSQLKPLLKEIHRCSSAPIQTIVNDKNEWKKGLNEEDPTLHVLSFPNTSTSVIGGSLSNLEKFSPNKKHQKYLVIIEKILDQNIFKTWLREIFQQMWQRNVLNVICVFYHKKKLQAFTYNPFDPAKYFIALDPREFQDLFYRNLGNLHQHPIYVSMYVDGVRSFGKSEHGFDGVDGNFAELLEEKLNATFIYLDDEKNVTKTAFLGFSSNDSLIDDVADVMSAKANISMNSRWLYEQHMIENTNSYEQNNLCVIVPKATQIPSFYNLFYTMEAWTWVAAIIFTIVVTGVYFVVQVSNRRFVDHGKGELELSVIDIFFYMLQSFFGDSLTRLPRSISLRLIIITWFCYAMIITTAFTGTLISKIAIPLYENDMETIEELINSEMNILILDYVYQTRHIWDPRLYETLKPQLHFKNKTEYEKYLIRNTTGLAYALSDSRADFEMARMGENKAGRPFYHKMRDCLIYFPRGYIATMGSPYIGMINDILGRFFEAGFNKHWEEMAQFKARIKGIISDTEEDEDTDDQEDEDKRVILSVQHLESAFYLLAIGLAISTVTFIAEHIVYRYQESRKNKVVYLNRNLAIRREHLDHLRPKQH